MIHSEQLENIDSRTRVAFLARSCCSARRLHRKTDTIRAMNANTMSGTPISSNLSSEDRPGWRGSAASGDIRVLDTPVPACPTRGMKEQLQKACEFQETAHQWLQIQSTQCWQSAGQGELEPEGQAAVVKCQDTNKLKCIRLGCESHSQLQQCPIRLHNHEHIT